MNSDSDETSSWLGSMVIWIPVGIAVGIIGAIVFDAEIAIGVAMGTSIGVALSIVVGGRKGKSGDQVSEPPSSD